MEIESLFFDSYLETHIFLAKHQKHLTMEILSYILAGGIVFLAIYLGITTSILKNPTPNTDKCYSFARVQMMWWTVIVSCCFIIKFGLTGEYQVTNTSTLTLLGIGLATTAGASLIDVSQRQTSNTRHQDGGAHNFFMDILSDETGISMHRFQAFIFTVLFGVVFIIIFIKDQSFASFSTTELGLMGLSSGTYLALKTNENKMGVPTAMSPPNPITTQRPPLMSPPMQQPTQVLPRPQPVMQTPPMQQPIVQPPLQTTQVPPNPTTQVPTPQPIVETPPQPTTVEPTPQPTVPTQPTLESPPQPTTVQPSPQPTVPTPPSPKPTVESPPQTEQTPPTPQAPPPPATDEPNNTAK